MEEKLTPCVVYRRSRYGQKRADHFANVQQNEAEEALTGRGFAIVGRYGDPEFAPPFLGYLEPRPAWQMALDAAAEKCVKHGRCALLVLRSDGIGDGDPFIPGRSLRAEYASLDIRVAGCSLRGHPTDMNLAAAHRYMDRFIEVERQDHFKQVIKLGRSEDKHEIVLRTDPFRNVVRVYYANYREQPLGLRWQTYARDVVQGARWPRAVDWDELEIPPKSAMHLHSFIQGDPAPKVLWWRFKVGQKRETKVGNVVVAPQNLAAASLPIDWYAYKPQELGPEDFHWESAPRIKTRRLRFRNWGESDLHQVNDIFDPPGAINTQVGHNGPGRMAADVGYFMQLGFFGPTYWAVERREDRQLIGFCGLLPVTQEGAYIAGEWEIGWQFVAAAQGDDIAMEAASAVVKAAFEQWHSRRVICRIHNKNLNSRRLAERLGFCKESSDTRGMEAIEEEGVLYKMTEEMFFRLGRGPAALETSSER